MKRNHLLGILGGGIVLSITVVWWWIMPGPLELQPRGPSPRSASVLHSDFVAEHRPRPSEPQQPAEANVPKLEAESPAEDSLEQRCLRLAERDPREAVMLANQSTDPTPHPGLLENLVGQWATHDLQASYQWVLQQQPGEGRDGLMARVVFVGSQSDPAAAASIVTDEMTPGQRQIEAAISVLHQWALRDLNAAEVWATAFPDGPLRQRALGEIEGIRETQRTAGP